MSRGLQRPSQLPRRSFLFSSAALAGVGILGSGDDHGEQIHSRRVPVASLMTECANHFLTAPDPDHRSKATFPIVADERMNWHYIPRERKGAPLREMTPS